MPPKGADDTVLLFELDACRLQRTVQGLPFCGPVFLQRLSELDHV